MARLDELLDDPGVQVSIEDQGAGYGSVVVHTEVELLSAIRVGMAYSTRTLVTLRPVPPGSMLARAEEAVTNVPLDQLLSAAQLTLRDGHHDHLSRAVAAARDLLDALLATPPASSVVEPEPASLCHCEVPDPVMQADMRFYCHTCSLPRPSQLCGRCYTEIVDAIPFPE